MGPQRPQFELHPSRGPPLTYCWPQHSEIHLDLKTMQTRGIPAHHCSQSVTRAHRGRGLLLAIHHSHGYCIPAKDAFLFEVSSF